MTLSRSIKTRDYVHRRIWFRPCVLGVSLRITKTRNFHVVVKLKKEPWFPLGLPDSKYNTDIVVEVETDDPQHILP